MRSDTNRAIHPKRIARNLKFWKWRDYTIYVAKKKGNAQLCGDSAAALDLVFAYAKSRFSYDRVHITIGLIVVVLKF